MLPHEAGAGAGGLGLLAGQFLNALFGYSSKPEWITVVAWLAYVVVVLALYLRPVTPPRPRPRPGVARRPVDRGAAMTEDRATVTVAGTGRTSRAADVADATFVAEALRPTAVEARATAAIIAAGVLDAVGGAGVAAEDLHTAGLDVRPTWEHDGTRMVRPGSP